MIILEQRDQLPCLRIQHPQATALIALQGAQLLEYTPAGQQPVIWLSETASFKTGKSVRGGIPVCWPWFGDLRKNPVAVQQTIDQDQAPAHGWVRNLAWVVESVQEDDAAAEITLRYPMPASIPAAWAPDLELLLTIRVGQTLQLRLRCTHHGQQTLNFSQALHTYFAVSHIDQVEIRDLEQVTYIDTLKDWQECQAPTPLRVDQEVDRIYLDTPTTIRFHDAGWQRTVWLRCGNSRSAVVWNPWIDKAQRLSDFADDAYQRMLCIETARVMQDCVTLAPGQTDQLELTIGLE